MYLRATHYILQTAASSEDAEPLLMAVRGLAVDLGALDAKFMLGHSGDLLIIVYTSTPLIFFQFQPIFQWCTKFTPINSLFESKPSLVWHTSDMSADSECSPLL
jgi:hypothetical protein